MIETRFAEGSRVEVRRAPRLNMALPAKPPAPWTWAPATIIQVDEVRAIPGNVLGWRYVARIDGGGLTNLTYPWHVRRK